MRSTTSILYLLYVLLALLLNSVGIVIHKSLNLYSIDEVSASSLEAYKDLPIALVSLFAGSFLPRWGHKFCLQFSLWLVSAVCLLVYFYPGFWTLKLLFAGVGVGFAGSKISLYALASEKEGFIHRLEAWFMVGVTAAFWVFPLFFVEEEPLAWTRIYLVLGALFALVALRVSSFPFPPLVNAGTREVVSSLKSPVLWGFGACAFFYVMVEQGIMTWLPTFNERALAISEAWSVRLAVILSLGIALGRMTVARYFTQVAWLKILLYSMAGTLVFLLLPALSSAPVFAWSFPWIGLFLGPIYPLISTAVMRSTPAAKQAAFASLMVFFSALGGTGGARIMGYWFKMSSHSFVALVLPLALLGISAVFLSRSIAQMNQN